MDLTPYYPVLQSTTLLRGLTEEDLTALLPTLAPQPRRYQKGALILAAGDAVHQLGLVLAGSITAAKTAPDGTPVVMAAMGPGGLFADVLGGAGAKSPVTVTAAADCLVLHLPYAALLHPAPGAGQAHWVLLQNLVQTISQKYFALERRLELLTCKSLRGRIALWLLAQREAAGSDTFATPLTRAQLAAYLGCERSALSRELGRMQADGLLQTRRGVFTVVDVERLQGLHGDVAVPR